MAKRGAKRKLNPRLIKSQSSYEVNKLVKVLGVHPNTIHNMIKEGLPIIEGSYPFLIYGGAAKDFITERQRRRKAPLKQDEFHCLRCRKGTKAKNGFAELEILSPKVGNLKAICEECDITKTNRRISLKDLPKFHAVIKIQELQNPRLVQGLDNSVICETDKDEKNG